MSETAETAQPAGEHTEHEDDPWSVELPDHPRRTESAWFRAAKETAHKILALIREQDGQELLTSLAGPGGVQAHHAGSLFLYADGRWLQVLNLAGVEWSAQWSADPAKIDLLRQNAQRLYERFPETPAELEKLGYKDAAVILSTPITDHDGVARWTDSIFNSCVLLSPLLHQGIVAEKRPVGGWHHYPKSIWDMQVTKRDDFRLWVTDEAGHPVAVAPVDKPGSGDARVQVLYTHPDSALHAEHLQHAAAGEPHILEADHPLAQQAFAQQSAPAETATEGT